MKMTDIIADMILDMFDDGQSTIQIQRNDLASQIGCVPSQINYVITSRFTPEQGYVVESRRGGGGYIRIRRIKTDDKTMLMHVVNSIGDSLDKMTAEVMLKNLYREQILDRKTANIMAVALSDRALRSAPQNIRDNLRADIFKNMLISTLS